MAWDLNPLSLVFSLGANFLTAFEVIFGYEPGQVSSLDVHFFCGLAPVAACMFQVHGDESFLEPVECVF